MQRLFESCRSIPAVEVARGIGLPVHQRGSKWWACCPLHNEKTPSLMFDANGHWYCFGCGQGGDAVSFYASLRGLSQGEAARGLALQFGIAETEGEISAPYVPAPPTPATVLMRMATDWHKREWHRACTLRNKAAALIEREARKCSSAMSPGVALAESPEFWVWLAARSCAECRLDVLQDANAKDLLSMMREEDNEFEESDC